MQDRQLRCCPALPTMEVRGAGHGLSLNGNDCHELGRCTLPYGPGAHSFSMARLAILTTRSWDTDCSMPSSRLAVKALLVSMYTTRSPLAAVCAAAIKHS